MTMIEMDVFYETDGGWCIQSPLFGSDERSSVETGIRADHKTRQAGGEACPRRKKSGRHLQFYEGEGFHRWRCSLSRVQPRRMGKSVLILLDTHIVLWLAFDATRLSKKAKTTVEEARQSGEGVAISDITLLELAMLARKKRILLGLSLGSFLSEVERRFVVLPMNGHICVRAFALPSTYPKDPADRVIAATALVQGLPLITADREIVRSHAVPTIW